MNALRAEKNSKRKRMLFSPENRVQKIFLIIPTLTKGGAERVVSLLSQEFERMGYKVKIVQYCVHLIGNW